MQLNGEGMKLRRPISRNWFRFFNIKFMHSYMHSCMVVVPYV